MSEEVPNYAIRLMKREDIPAVLELWRETGLSEGTYTLDTWYDHDPEGFYVAVTDEGTVIGACSGVLQHEDLAFIGLYVVKAAHRRKGVGMKIWNAVLERIGDRNIGVNPVPEQLENYRDKSGFPVQTTWCSKVCLAAKIDTSQFDYDASDVDVRVLTPQDEELVQRVVRYDADVCEFRRGDLVPLLCNQKDSVTMAAIRNTDQEVCGYGNIKLNIKGNALVGPLYADDVDVAGKLLHELIKAFPVAGEKGALMFSIDSNEPGMNMIEKLGFKTKETIARLYRKEEVHVKYEKVFGQQNLNFSIF